ncbi:MAG: AAA family ATPase [Crenarchaeota archaeon]|nr:AAA family ATPase [Thermoproteota archaeon]
MAITPEKEEKNPKRVAGGKKAWVTSAKLGAMRSAKWKRDNPESKLIKEEKKNEQSLLKFVRDQMQMNANYQPIVIKMLLEKKDEEFSASINDIRKKFNELNFGRYSYTDTLSGEPMGNSAIKSVAKALEKFVTFPESTSQGNAVLHPDSFSVDEIPEILETCGQRIAQWHIEELKMEEIEYYFIRAGKNGDRWKEFRTNNFVAIDYLDKNLETEATGDFNLSGLTKDEIEKRKGNSDDVTELYNISQIKKGDIIAVVNDLKTVKEFAIATSNYYFEKSVKKMKHRVNVEYLNFGSLEIRDGNQKGIMRDDSQKIKNFLTKDKLEYFILRHSLKGKTTTIWKDEIGKKYHIGRDKDGSMGKNVQKLLDAGVGTKAVWISNAIKGITYVLGYGTIKSFEEIKKDEDWNVIFENYNEFHDKEMSEVVLEELKALEKNKDSKYNWQLSINQIPKKLYQQFIGEDLTSEEEEIDTVTNNSRTIEILKRKKNIILYGPPGTGKTYTAEKIADQMKGVTKFITFHQSYGYEEFIEGIRPEPTDKGITYPVKDGVFKRFCQSLPKMTWKQAAFYVLHEKDTSLHWEEITKVSIEYGIDPKEHLWNGHERLTPEITQAREMSEDIRINNEDSIFKRSRDDKGEEINGMYEVNKESTNYQIKIDELDKITKAPKIFIIDEINRGNISKIFGELITIIENNKRDKEVTLAYSGEQFSVPPNVYIIGTMNTADQSLSHIDAALKRRFSSIEVPPDYLILKEGMNGISELLEEINKKIREKISRDKQIGHSYFMQDGKAITSIDELQFVFATDIIPLLRDYFYDSDDDLKTVLGGQFIDWKDGSDRNVKEDWQNNPEIFRTAIETAYHVQI